MVMVMVKRREEKRKEEEKDSPEAPPYYPPSLPPSIPPSSSGSLPAQNLREGHSVSRKREEEKEKYTTKLANKVIEPKRKEEKASRN